MHDVSEFNQFFIQFRKGCNGDGRWLDRLNQFFRKFRDLNEDLIAADSKQPVTPQISAEVLRLFLLDFKAPIHEHYRHGYGVNVWQVAGVKCDEVRNSSILSWLLDCNGSHGQGNIFLEGLLGWLCNDKKVPQEARKFLPKPGCTHGIQYWTRAESLPLGEKESRVDIEIGGPFVLIIEVKINAVETGNQLKRYLEIAQKKSINNKWAVLYLTRHGTPPDDESLHEHICRISWHQMISVISDVTQKKVPKNSFIEHQIKQFCGHIKSN
jgi:hypothetical protein